MNNQSFINVLSSRVGMDQRSTQVAVNAVAAALTELLTADASVTVQGFGTFDVKKKTERVVTMPGVGKRLLVPPKITATFKPNIQLKERLREH